MDLKGIEMTWLGHATFRFRYGDGTTVIIDPWLEGNPACPPAEETWVAWVAWEAWEAWAEWAEWAE